MAMNRRILFQVTLPAVLISLALFGTCLLSIRSINQLQTNQATIRDKNVRSLQAAQELQIALRQLRFHSFLYVMDPTPIRHDPIDQDHREFEAALQQVRQTADLPDERDLIEAIETGYRHYRANLDNASNYPSSRATRSDLLRWADAHPIRHLMTTCEEFLRINRDAMEATARESEAIGNQARTAMFLLGVLGPLGGMIGGFGVAWGLSRTISRLSVRLQDVHAHLDQNLGSLRLTAVGDFHQLDRQLEQVLYRVREVVAESQRQQKEVLRAEQLAAVGQLAASVAHEVRNPLTSIKLLVGAALRSHPHKPLRMDDLHVIHEEVQRLERKVQALLDFARPPDSRRQLSDVGDLIRQAIELVRARLRQQNVQLELALPTQPVSAYLDRDQFTSVLVNLFMNALDAMPQSGRLIVALRKSETAEFELTVIDTGKGIDVALADKLFTPFTSTKSTGTGLGLSVCRRVVQDHGGQLLGANRPEGGACFTITLPVSGHEVCHADATDR